MLNSVLVRFEISSEVVTGGFYSRQVDFDPLTLDSEGPLEDLGDIISDPLDAQRVELVMETSVEDARRVRQLSGVHHVAQRKVGELGRVRITVDLPATSINEAAANTRIWAQSNIRASAGVLLYQSKQQWDELSVLMGREAWAAGRIICESPRWVLINTSDGLSSDDVLSRLMELRVAGLLTEDISYRLWHRNADDRVIVSTGIIDTGASAEIANVNPRFTTRACLALLRAINISVATKNIAISEGRDSDGNAFRTVRVSAARNDIDRLVGIPRRFVWEGEPLKVVFSKVPDVMDRRPRAQSPTPRSSDGNSRASQHGKRGHVHGETPPRKTKSKISQPAAQCISAEDGAGSDELDLSESKEQEVTAEDAEGDVDVSAGADAEVDAEADNEDVAAEEGDADVCDNDSDAETQEMSPGDVIQAPKLREDGTNGPQETLRLVAQDATGWQAQRLVFAEAKVRTRGGSSPGWIVEQPQRHPATKWFGHSRYGNEAENEAWRCKREWDAEDSAAMLVEDSGQCGESGAALYSLKQARKCDALEVEALLSGDSTEGRTEWARRQSALKFHGKLQQEGAGSSGEMVGDPGGDSVDVDFTL